MSLTKEEKIEMGTNQATEYIHKLHDFQTKRGIDDSQIALIITTYVSTLLIYANKFLDITDDIKVQMIERLFVNMEKSGCSIIERKHAVEGSDQCH